jgi:diguanylate cyclase (GGDEF)-like protein
LPPNTLGNLPSRALARQDTNPQTFMALSAAEETRTTGSAAASVRRSERRLTGPVLSAAVAALLWIGSMLGGGVLAQAALAAVLFAPLLAAGFSAVAAAAPSAGASRVAWAALAVAGGVGGAAQTAALAGGASAADAVLLLHGAALAALLAGIGWLLHCRTGGRAAEVGLDAALLAGAALVLVLSRAPAPPVGGAIGAAALVLAPTAGLCLLLLGAVLLRGLRRPLRQEPRLALAAGTLLLGASGIQQLAAGSPCCGAAHGAGGLAFGGWLFVAAAALLAVGAWPGEAESPEGADLLRMTVAPLAGIVLAVSLVRPVPAGVLSGVVALATALLALLLAARVLQLLDATRRLSQQRRELEQSRALVEVSRALAGSNDLDDTLQLVTRWACRLLGARGATIELISDDGALLTVHSSCGLPPSVMGMRSPVATTFTGWVVRHARARSTSDPGAESDIASEGLPYLEDATLAAAPLHHRERTLGALACIGSRPFDDADLELLGALAEQAAIAIENARLFHEVRMLSLTDPLTGLANRRQLEHDLAREVAAARRGRRLVAVMFDLDGFKEYNDRFGHLAGDAALRSFAETLGGLSRRSNVAVRFGGDEFLAILTDTDRVGGDVFVQRVRERFEENMTASGRLGISVAAGVAEFRPEMADGEELLEAADRALYYDKVARPRT